MAREDRELMVNGARRALFVSGLKIYRRLEDGIEAMAEKIITSSEGSEEIVEDGSTSLVQWRWMGREFVLGLGMSTATKDRETVIRARMTDGRVDYALESKESTSGFFAVRS